MNHLDFLDTATRLMARDTPTEADIRSAISRSYYAVYHHVLAWWKSNNRFPNYRDRGHAKIQMAFFNAGMPESRNFSIELKKLSAHRQEADYELTIEFNLKRGWAIVNLAHRTIAAFDGLNKTTLSEGILNYLQRTNQI